MHVPESLLHPLAFAVGLAIVVYLHVVMGEMIPKNIALAGPDRAALVLGTPVWACVTVLRPVIRIINAVASALLRLVGVHLVGNHGECEVAVGDHPDRPSAVADDDRADVPIAHQLADVAQAVAALGGHDSLGHHLGDPHGRDCI